MSIESRNPATNLLLRSFEPLTEDALEQKIALAASAFRSRGQLPLEHRTMLMRRLAALLEEEVEEHARLITTEMGKPLHAARQEVLKSAQVCRFYAEHAARILAPEAVATQHAHSFVRWEPLGVILAVLSADFPFWQAFRVIAPLLMAGNIGLLQQASHVPQCALAVETLTRRAGFPRGRFQTLLIEPAQVERVLADPRVAAVTVTGSKATGRAIAAQAGWLIKKSTPNLGGSDPFIVLPTANLDQTVAAAVQARCANAGQSPIAAKRFLIHTNLYDDFAARFIAGMEALQIGDPTLDDTALGPLATRQAVTELERQIESALAAGATLLTGGERMIGDGNFFEPTILANLPRNVPVYREEFLGPVALLFRFSTLEEALEIANDTPYGLAASIWTHSEDEQRTLILGLECGSVFVNEVVSTDPRLPFGGTKLSGFGRELSAAGMHEFLNAKTVVIA